MNETTKKVLLIVLVLFLAGFGTGYYLWHKPHENMSERQADMALDAGQLFKEYSDNEDAANAKYLDKVIAVAGKVKESAKSEDGKTAKIILDTGADFGVSCELDPLATHPRTDFQPGDKVTFKGKCTGLNFDVQLARCVEIK